MYFDIDTNFRVLPVSRYEKWAITFTYIFRKLDLRELKVLQKEENRQYQDLMVKTTSAKENLDRQVNLFWPLNSGYSRKTSWSSVIAYTRINTAKTKWHAI